MMGETFAREFRTAAPIGAGERTHRVPSFDDQAGDHRPVASQRALRPETLGEHPFEPQLRRDRRSQVVSPSF